MLYALRIVLNDTIDLFDWYLFKDASGVRMVVWASENDNIDEACEALYTYISSIAFIVRIRALFTQKYTLQWTVRTIVLVWYDKQIYVCGMW